VRSSLARSRFESEASFLIFTWFAKEASQIASFGTQCTLYPHSLTRRMGAEFKFIHFYAGIMKRTGQCGLTGLDRMAIPTPEIMCVSQPQVWEMATLRFTAEEVIPCEQIDYCYGMASSRDGPACPSASALAGK
jgi:hypothetical protein